MLVCGIVVHRPINSRNSYSYKKVRRLDIGSLAGLVTVYLFFVGETGYLSFAVQQAIARGMIFENAALSLALIKSLAGIVVIYSAYVGYEDAKSTRYWNLTVIIIIAIISLYYSRHIVVFFLALLAIEV